MESHYCSTRAVECAIYVDDRILWPNCPGDASAGRALAEALNKSDLVDKAFGLSCRPDKCALVAPEGDQTLRELWHRKYPKQQVLHALGVVIDVCTRDSTLLKLSLRMALLRLRYLRTLNPPLDIKRRLIRSLIMPTFTWAAGAAGPSTDELQELKDGILWALRTSVTWEAPWALLCAVHGWDWDPDFALDWAALRIAARYCGADCLLGLTTFRCVKQFYLGLSFCPRPARSLIAADGKSPRVAVLYNGTMTNTMCALSDLATITCRSLRCGWSSVLSCWVFGAVLGLGIPTIVVTPRWPEA